MFIQDHLGNDYFNDFDGELVVGLRNHPNVMQNTASGVKKASGEPDFTYWVYDYTADLNLDYEVRAELLFARIKALPEGFKERVKFLEQVLIHNMEELDEYEAKQITDGLEGIMIRRAKGKYKQGRSTVKEGYLLKVKRFSHDEATIVGFEEECENTNEKEFNEVGGHTRSTVASGLIGKGMCGSFWVKSPKYDNPFKVSCGSMTHEQRREVWENQGEWINVLIRFKYFAHGMVDVPRHPLYDGVRDLADYAPEY